MKQNWRIIGLPILFSIIYTILLLLSQLILSQLLNLVTFSVSRLTILICFLIINAVIFSFLLWRLIDISNIKGKQESKYTVSILLMVFYTIELISINTIPALVQGTLSFELLLNSFGGINWILPLLISMILPYFHKY